MKKNGDFVFWSTTESIVRPYPYFLDPILGHPVYQFLPKLEFSDFTVSATGFWKYVSLCSSNSYITYYGIQVGDAKLRYILLICWCDSISKFGYEREIGIVMSNAMQWSSYTPTRWKIVGRMNKIRDLFKVKLYTIRSETKR